MALLPKPAVPQLGSGSSLWSAGWLLEHVISRLSRLTTLHLPRAFLGDTTHPDFLPLLAALTGITDLALGSVIMSAGNKPATITTTIAAVTATTAPSNSTQGDVSDDGGSNVKFPAASEAVAAVRPSLVRRWRRLALGAAMPCYLESLLPLMLGSEGGYDSDREWMSQLVSKRLGGTAVTTQPMTPSHGSEAEAAAGTAHTAGWGDGGCGFKHGNWKRAGAGTPEALCTTPATAVAHVQDVGDAGSGREVGRLEVLELSTPCMLHMVQLLPRFLRQCTTDGDVAEAVAAAGDGSVQEVRLILRLAANWKEVLAAAAAAGRVLTSLALFPTYLYSSGTMMGSQVHGFRRNPMDVGLCACNPGRYNLA